MVGDNYNFINEIKEYASLNNVPIMSDEGISFLSNYILKTRPKNILEVGTAIGYSAIKMALLDEDITITTIERDEKRYLEAIKNIKKFNLENRIRLIYKDALDVKLDEEYDLIFIDAAKAQNIKFFELFEKNLKSCGTIITDNMNFHGFLNKKSEEITSRNLRALVRKIKDYHEWLKSNTKYNTSFYEIGDGVAVSIKKV